MKFAMLLVITAVSLFGQSGQPVNQTIGTPPFATQSLFYNSGGLITYVCIANSVQTETTVTVSAASNANPVSFTATAHNFGDYANLGATVNPIVKITGGTGNWAAVVGTWTATPTSANAFTIPVNSTAFGALTGTLVVTTISPRHNLPVWGIYHLTYDGSNYLTSKGWAQLPGGLSATNLNGGSTGQAFKCSSRALLAYQ